MKRLISTILVTGIMTMSVSAAELSMKFNPESEMFVINGVAEGTVKNGLVAVTVKADKDGKFGWAGTIKTNESGAFSESFGFSPDTAGGYYTATIGTLEGGIIKSVTFYYATEEQKKDALQAINSATTTEELDVAINENMLILGINEELYNSLGKSKKDVLMILLEETFSEPNQLLIALDNAMGCALINNAGKDNIGSVVEEYFTFFELNNSELYDEYLTLDKEYVYKKMLGADCKSKDDVKKLFETAVALSVINKTIKWNDFKITMDAYVDYTGIDKTYYNKCNKDELASAICDYDYMTPQELYDAIKKFYDSNKKDTSSGGSGGGIGSGGGGGGGGGNREEETDKQETPVEPQIPAEDGKETSVYSDLNGYDWAEEAITALTEKGLINGDGTGKFNPSAYITREEFVKIILPAVGLFNEGEECEFSDVDKENWAYSYIASAYKSGIVNGIGEGVFGFGKRITRQDIAVLIDRVAKQAGIDFAKVNEKNFVDGAEISDYARESVKAMSAAGIINGDDMGNFAPLKEATRAEAAVMIYRLLEDKED